MTDQPEALRLANSLAAHSLSRHGQTQAARLLREQHAEIERLRADAERYRYLKERVEHYDGWACFPDVRLLAPIPDCSPFCPVDAAIDAAKGEK